MRIFISHSSGDVDLASLLVDLLRASLALPASAILCTSVDGHRLIGGEQTDEALRKEIRECEAFIGLISATSIESAYVLFELGARWGAGRHLLPLLAPTADSSILRGPLLGLNALKSSHAGDLHQMVSEIAAILGIAPQPPASYQRHLERIIASSTAEKTTGASDNKSHSSSARTPHDKVSADEYEGAETIMERHCEQKWGDDYSMREYCLREEERALADLRAGRPADIPEDVFRRIRRQAAQKWPFEFSMRLFTEQQEFDAFRKLQARRRS